MTTGTVGQTPSLPQRDQCFAGIPQRPLTQIYTWPMIDRA